MPKKQQKQTDEVRIEPQPLGRKPKSGYGQPRDVRLVVMLTAEEDAAYREHCERAKCSRQTPAREAMAAKFPWISKQ